jgi:asparagine synthase (glutamine-hydrolysing)
MVHRGPDGGGLWRALDNRCALAHRRLSIIDLSTAADQPMANHDNSVVVTFNGEIYNHAELRQELMALGKYRWVTDHSDTEVLLHAYEEWGLDCAHLCRRGPRRLLDHGEPEAKGLFGIGVLSPKRDERVSAENPQLQ